MHHLLRHFGVRFFAWDETYIPTVPWTLGVQGSISPPAVDITFVPPFEYVPCLVTVRVARASLCTPVWTRWMYVRFA